MPESSVSDLMLSFILILNSRIIILALFIKINNYIVSYC